MMHACGREDVDQYSMAMAPYLQIIALYGRPSVDVLQADDVVLVELAKGYLKDPHRRPKGGALSCEG